jgi:hypothetical protein
MTVDYQKVWRTMNDLEQVIAKVVSAREMIDIANECCSSNQQERAESMTMAAYEFLGYFIEEFDEKFKDAWQATVGDLRSGDGCDYTATGEKFPRICDRDDQSPECKGAWNSFWGDVNNWSEEPQQYTEEELNAMCDKAELDAEVERIRQEGGYDWTPSTKPDKVKKWILPVEECKDADTDEIEYFVSFPDDLLEAANLKEGDQIEWVDNAGSYTLKKVTKPLGPDEC